MKALVELPLVTSYAQRNSIIENSIRKNISNNQELQILEAGCGQCWEIDLTGVNYRLTGIDLDRVALSIRIEKYNDLNEIIEGDLRDVDLGGRTFDAIYNSYVLEHVSGAETVLCNFVKWTKPGGVIIIKIPDPSSVKGFITRITPHWFHIFYYKHLLGIKTAGRPGFMPYPTYFDSVVSRQGINKFCEKNGLQVEAEYGEGLTKPGVGVRRILIQLFIRTVAFVSFGVLSSKHTNLLYILRRDKAVGRQS